MSRKLLEIALAVLALTGFVIGCYGLFCIRDACRGVSLCDTTMYVDTLVYYRPVPKDSMVIKYVTRTLPVKHRDSSTTNKTDTFLAENSRSAVLRLHSAEHVQAQLCSHLHEDVSQNNGENIRIMRNSGCARQNSDKSGSSLAGTEIPPQEMSDERDSMAVEIPITQKRYEGEGYRVYVSGYEPNLDSVYVFQRTAVVHERSYKPPNKWHIGITGGYGYGFKSKHAEPYIGIGITYSIISFAF